MTEKRILVVDDDPKVRTLLRRALEGQGYHVIEAADGDTVRKVFADAPPDIVTLDLTLGAEDGFDIARDIRRQHDVPIIMVTGKDDVIDRVVGLELGADDYLTKPFHVREVLARVRSVLRRYGGQVPGPAMQTAETDADRQTMRLDGLHIDHDRMEVTRRDGTACDLTSGEFRLLAAFIAHPRRPGLVAAGPHDRQPGGPSAQENRTRSRESGLDQDRARRRIHIDRKCCATGLFVGQHSLNRRRQFGLTVWFAQDREIRPDPSTAQHTFRKARGQQHPDLWFFDGNPLRQIMP